jgi:gamma-glutamyl:cysteine ligase YbdK (ATP-grasp superfamily)
MDKVWGMGLEIDRDHFDEADYARFGSRLRECLDALRAMLARPGFGEGPATIGAELEVDLVDARGRPRPLNREILADAVDPRISLEIDRFNLEINTHPLPLAGRPFAALADELSDALRETSRAASRHRARVVTIGILPTLEPSDLRPGALTDVPRYRALSAHVRASRHVPFHVHIDGLDTLDIETDDVTLEGANTAFQLHLRVAPGDYARAYNAAQLATPVVLALSANSPTFLGRRLWDETRIALFRQSVDDRPDTLGEEFRPARVSFGHGWVREGAFELFAETVAMHAPLLPVLSSEDPLARVRAGEVPALRELRLHNSTVWRWNRAVYDDTEGGHLRIEMRALPSGPTVADTVASAALLTGLTLGLAEDSAALLHRLTYGHARRNFYEAARRGLDAELLWPRDECPSPRRVSVLALVPELLSVTRRGLARAGVAEDEIDHAMRIVAGRVEARATGATWQRRVVERLGGSTPEALERMFARYAELSALGRPVHEWPEEGA